MVLLKRKRNDNSHSLGVVVDGVVADEERGVEGLRQQRVDGDHHQQHRQLQHRVQPQEYSAGHHGEDPREHEVLGGETSSLSKSLQNQGRLGRPQLTGCAKWNIHRERHSTTFYS